MIADKIRTYSILAAITLPLLITACGDVSGPSPVNSLSGWVVGDLSNGYGDAPYSVVVDLQSTATASSGALGLS